MANYIGKKLIVRCDRAGVFFGTLQKYDSTTREATLADVRRIFYWDGAASLTQMAAEGVKKPQNCRFTQAIPEMTVMEVIELIPCSDESILNLECVPVWKI